MFRPARFLQPEKKTSFFAVYLFSRLRSVAVKAPRGVTLKLVPYSRLLVHSQPLPSEPHQAEAHPGPHSSRLRGRHPASARPAAARPAGEEREERGGSARGSRHTPAAASHPAPRLPGESRGAEGEGGRPAAALCSAPSLHLGGGWKRNHPLASSSQGCTPLRESLHAGLGLHLDSWGSAKKRLSCPSRWPNKIEDPPSVYDFKILQGGSYGRAPL